MSPSTEYLRLLRIPTGGRQTPWLFKSATGNWNRDPTWNKFGEWSERGLELGISGSQGTGPNHSATLPSCINIFWDGLQVDLKQHIYVVLSIFFRRIQGELVVASIPRD